MKSGRLTVQESRSAALEHLFDPPAAFTSSARDQAGDRVRLPSTRLWWVRLHSEAMRDRRSDRRGKLSLTEFETAPTAYSFTISKIATGV
jgi:hypothetical protein